MKFTVSFPTTKDLGPFKTIVNEGSWTESKEENALWHYNNSREHDGLPPLTRLPRGTTFEPIHEVD
jgi:hypothetical protein